MAIFNLFRVSNRYSNNKIYMKYLIIDNIIVIIRNIYHYPYLYPCSDNFASVKIYFSQLNYENIEEIEDYGVMIDYIS